MSLMKMYKPGQGKVTRITVAVAAGVLCLGMIFWIANEVGQAYGHLQDVPTVLGTLDQDVAPGRDHLRPSLTLGPAIAEQVSAAVDLEAGGAGVRVLPPEQGVTAAQQAPITLPIVEVDASKGVVYLEEPIRETLRAGSRVALLQGTNYLIYVQGGVWLVLALLAGGLLLWVLNSHRVVDFLIATELEMRKVNWPVRREVIGSTWVVISGTLLMAVFLWVVDMVFLTIFSSFNVLEGGSPLLQLFS